MYLLAQDSADLCKSCQCKTARKQDNLQEAIHICKDANVLKEHLESRESEILNITIKYYKDARLNNRRAFFLRKEIKVGIVS